MGEFDVGSAHRALQLLLDHNLYGSLIVSDGLSDVCFFFTRGGLRVVSSGRQLPTLRARLLAQGRLDAERVRQTEKAIQEARQQAQERGKPVDAGAEERQALIESLRVPAAEVDEATRELVAEILLDCLFWEKPQFEASTAEPDLEVTQRRDLSALVLSLGVSELIQKIIGRLRTVGELRRTMGSLAMSVEPTAKGREAVERRERLGEGVVGEHRTRLMRLVVGEPGLRAADIPRRLGCGELELASLLQELSTQDYLRVTRAQDDPKQDLERVRKMEEAIDQALSQLLRRVRMAHDSAKGGDPTRAARHMARAGGLLLQSGRAEEASKTFAGALKHAEGDLEAREGYVQSLWQTGHTQEALLESDALGKRYLELNLPGRAKRVLERALGREERTSTLELLVNSLVKLRQPKLATEAGERWINRLRREGKREEARAAAARLLRLADDADRQRLLRAAGVDKRRSLALAVSLVVLLVGLVPIQARAEARERYARLTRDYGAKLGRAKSVSEAARLLEELGKQLPAFASAPGQVGPAAATVEARLKPLQADVALFQRLVTPHLPWRQAPDLRLARDELDKARQKALTAGLKQALTALLEEIDAHTRGAKDLMDRLSALEPGPEAAELARRLLEEYEGYPGLLVDASVRFRLESDPPGAKVRWGSIDYSTPTPLDLVLPLLGTKELELSLNGYRTAALEVGVDSLDEDGSIRVELTSVRRPADPRAPRRAPPKPAPGPAASPSPSPGASPGGVRVVTPAPQQTPAEDERPSVMTEDGGFAGEPAADLAFPGGEEFFASLRVDERRYRAAIQLVNEVAGSDVYLVGLRGMLMIRTRTGWRETSPRAVTLAERYKRPLVLQAGGHRAVLPVSRTLHLDREALLRQAQELLDGMVQDYEARRSR